MSLGANCLIQKLNKKIVDLGLDSQTSCNFAQISGSLNSLENNITLSVASETDLPSASDNKGRFVYVESIKSFRYSDGYYWTKDACSTSGICDSIFSWGFNSLGRLGDGTTVNRCSPGTIAGGGTTWCQVSGTYHTAAIKTDGTLWTWGYNCRGVLGNGTTVSRCSPGTVAGGGTTWCHVSGDTVAIKTDGTIWTWGSNSRGQLGDGTTASRCSPGTIWGSYTTWCQVSGAALHTAAIKTDGTLWTWGGGPFGQLGDGTTVDRCSPGTIAGGGTDWCKVFGGFFHTAAIKTDGTLWTWGLNSCGLLGDGTLAARCSPGTVAGEGTNWCQVAGGQCHTIAIKTDGTLWTWGGNGGGTLGANLSTSSCRCSPGTVVGEGTTWCQVSAGNYISSAIKTDGTLWTWGRNDLGQLGDGTVTSRCSPVIVAGGGTTWHQVSSARCHTVAIRTRGF